MGANADSLNIAASLKILDGAHLGTGEPAMDERLKTVAEDVATIKAQLAKLLGGLTATGTFEIKPKS